MAPRIDPLAFLKSGFSYDPKKLPAFDQANTFDGSVYNTKLPFSFVGLDTGLVGRNGRDTDIGMGGGIPPKNPGEFSPTTGSPIEKMLDFVNYPNFYKLRDLDRESRREEAAYNAQLMQDQFQSYLPAMRDLAMATRQADYDLGMAADMYSPTRQQARAASAQEQIKQAVGGEAAMLDAVNRAYYNNAMANIAGFRSGMRGA